ncbi:MAG TPA: putative metal-binding motif-containing protein, partial [Polyangiales bacterium]|nr:putative metal-binding motif-containing protein [Polyangiales bacterium]
MRLRWALLCLVCSGCSVLALSDEIHQDSCQIEEDCDILNDRNSREFDPCHIWQCDQHTKLCVFRQTDSDQDGTPPPFCVAVGTVGDCQDDDPTINPKAKEVCDGVDNDCDQSVDEGMLAISHDSALHFDDDVRELDYAWNPTSSELGVIYRNATDDRVGFNVLGGSRSTQAQPLLFSSDSTDVRGSSLATTVRVGHFLAGLAEAGASRRLWLGDVSSDMGRSRLRLGPG